VSTEIEAKFTVPDNEIFEALKSEPALARYSLQPGRLLSLHDTYLDTPGQALRAAGYACRRREQEGGIIMTLKAIQPPAAGVPGPAPGRGAEAVHRREELEVRLSQDSPPALWPPGEAREAALAVVRGELLEVLFDLRQERLTREVLDGERRVATLSLDSVEMARGETREGYRELEIELAPEGSEADLAALAAWVADQYGLLPAAGSKFERAMALLEAQESGGPTRRGTRGAKPVALREETVTLQAPEDLSQDALLAELSAMGYQARTRATRGASEVFFDSHDGALLRKGYLLGHSLDDGRWRFRKREIVEAEQEHDGEAPPEDGEIPAAVSRLTRSRVSIPFLQGSMRETEYRLRGLSAGAVRLFLQHWSFLSLVQEAAPRELLLVSARGSPQAAGLPYFLTLLRERLRCRAPEGTLLSQGLARLGLPVPGAKIPDRFLVSEQDSVPHSCRKVLAGEAWRMRASMAGARQDLDIEYVHLLRVATRRARFAVRLFAAFFPPDAAPAVRAELGWIAGLLGSVRDLDVLLDNLSRQVSLLDSPADFEEAVRGHLLRTRLPAREALAAALGSQRFEGLLALLESPPLAAGDGDGSPSVPHFAEGRVGKAMARLGKWMGRPTEDFLDADLHRLRILFKRLRYTCEFFRPLFPREIGELISACIGYQDCLGALQDAAVAASLLQTLAEDSAREAPAGFLMSLGALAQLQRDTRRAKREEFLQRWKSAAQLAAQWQVIRAAMEKSR
jgi:inorganic triphosphatase YgiF